MSQRRRFSLCTSCDPSSSQHYLPDTSHAQTGKYTNDYSNNVFFSLGEVNSQLPVRHPLSSSLARSLDNSQNLALPTIVRAMISTIFAPSWRRTWMRITKAHVVDAQSGAQMSAGRSISAYHKSDRKWGEQPERVRLNGQAP